MFRFIMMQTCIEAHTHTHTHTHTHRLRLYVDKRYIRPLPMYTRTNIEGTFVTLIEANHCRELCSHVCSMTCMYLSVTTHCRELWQIKVLMLWMWQFWCCGCDSFDAVDVTVLMLWMWQFWCCGCASFDAVDVTVLMLWMCQFWCCGCASFDAVDVTVLML